MTKYRFRVSFSERRMNMTFEEMKAKAKANKCLDDFLDVNDIYCLFCYKPIEEKEDFYYYLVIPYTADDNHTLIKDLRTNKSFFTPAEDTLQDDYYAKKYRGLLTHYGIIPDKDTKCFPLSFYRTIGQACKSGIVADSYLKKAYSFDIEQFSSMRMHTSDIVGVCDQITNHYYYQNIQKQKTQAPTEMNR